VTEAADHLSVPKIGFGWTRRDSVTLPGFKHRQSGVIDPIGFTHAVTFAFVQRVDIDLARIKRLHVGEKALDPR